MMKGEPGTVLKAWQKMAMVLSKDLGNTKSAKPTQKAQRKILIDLCFLRLFLCAFCVPCLRHPLNLMPLALKSQARLMRSLRDQEDSCCVYFSKTISLSTGVKPDRLKSVPHF